MAENLLRERIALLEEDNRVLTTALKGSGEERERAERWGRRWKAWSSLTYLRMSRRMLQELRYWRRWDANFIAGALGRGGRREEV